MRHPRILTPSEVEILREGISDPDYITDYFFRPFGSDHGFRFDYNFRPGGAWQKKVYTAAQGDIIVIGGFGTGKTVGFGMMGAVFSVLTQDFRFLNVAPTAYQAMLMYKEVLDLAKNTPFDEFIWEKPRRPFPKIVIKFQIGKVVYESTMEFMSADKNAVNILSWGGDWVHVDEAGLIDDLESLLINLGSRVRGHTQRGRERLGRISLSSNSWDNPWLWYLADLAIDDPDNYLTIFASTRDNYNISEKQLHRMVARIPEDERERFIDGTRPEGRGRYFHKDAVYAGEDAFIGEIIEKNAEKGITDYIYEKVQGAGVVKFQVPPKRGYLYVYVGDPGSGNAPHRNAPVGMIFGIPPEFPAKPAEISAFWWGSGHGSIKPFVKNIFEFQGVFSPFFVGIDSTGPQKNMATLLNEQVQAEETEFGQMAVDILGERAVKEIKIPIQGLDFSGAKKFHYLIALKLMLTAGLFRWPKIVTGIRSQLTNYEPENDKKIPQDIVATMAMGAHVLYYHFHLSNSLEGGEQDLEDGSVDPRERRSSTHRRETRRYVPARR